MYQLFFSDAKWAFKERKDMLKLGNDIFEITGQVTENISKYRNPKNLLNLKITHFQEDVGILMNNGFISTIDIMRIDALMSSLYKKEYGEINYTIFYPEKFDYRNMNYTYSEAVPFMDLKAVKRDDVYVIKISFPMWQEGKYVLITNVDDYSPDEYIKILKKIADLLHDYFIV